MPQLLVRGLAAGLLAGIAALVVALLLGEPLVSQAIALETPPSLDDPAASVPVVSRLVQSTLGLAAAFVLYGVSLGGLFAVAHALTRRRVSPATLAIIGFVTVTLVPFLKYPPNPPGVGVPDTLTHRTLLYLSLLLISPLLAVIVSRLPWRCPFLAVAVFLVAITLVIVALPSINETPRDFPATLLWYFRLSSLATQLVMWCVLGLVLSPLPPNHPRPAHLAQRQRPRPRAEQSPRDHTM